MKVYINGHGHMTKMAAMAINSKNFLNVSSPEPEGLCFLVVVPCGGPEKSHRTSI